MQQSREDTIRELFDNMGAIKRSMAGFMHATNKDCPISHAQLELLFTIRHLQPVSFKQLAQQLYLTPGAVSQLVEALEEHGLVSRHTDKQDRRIQCLQLTKAGDKLLQTTEKRRKTMMTKIIADLSDDELAIWLRVQHKLLQHIQTETNNQPR